MGREIIFGLHFYQPPRYATIPSLSDISTDPYGKDWTKVVMKECYRPLANEGVLDKASFDIFTTLLLQLDQHDPKLAESFRHAMKENGVGEPYIHPILPDLHDDDKYIVINAGVERFYEATGNHPRYFWSPESGIDTNTLIELSKAGYEGFICAPEQIIQSDGSGSDNTPTLIPLPEGRQIIALPFDRPISSNLGHGKKLNADTFAYENFAPLSRGLKNNQIPTTWTDAETFGHWWTFGDKFLEYLLSTSLPQIGLDPLPINQLKLNRNILPQGRIVERSSWSCPCGDLARWHGSCSCHNVETSWKKHFYHSMGDIDHSVTQLISENFGPQYKEVVAQLFHLIITQPEQINTPQLALIAAKVSSLISRTSCATFFESPEVSGRVSLIYAYQSITYLQQAGLLKEAQMIKDQLYKNLSIVHYPNSDKTALTTLQRMISPQFT